MRISLVAEKKQNYRITQILHIKIPIGGTEKMVQSLEEDLGSIPSTHTGITTIFHSSSRGSNDLF